MAFYFTPFFFNDFVDIYMSHAKDDSGSTYGDVSGFHGSNNDGFVSSGNSLGNQLLPKEESGSFSTASESSRVSDSRLEVSKRSTDSISALKELVSFLIIRETNCGPFIHLMLCQILLLIYYKF